MDAYNQEVLVEREQTICYMQREVRIIVALIMLPLVAQWLSMVPALRPNGETLATWLPRTGAIMTIFATWAQFRFARLADSMQGTDFSESVWLARMFRSHREFLSRSITFLAIWGALVWGYGDVVIRAILKWFAE